MNHPARLRNAALLVLTCTSITIIGQPPKQDDSFAKEEAEYTAQLKSSPTNASLYQRRGIVRFFQLKFNESLADFDKYIELMPSREPYHWQRGLVHYYAGKYKAGRRQFELHQTVNTQDVENAVWHYLCVAKTEGVNVAKKNFIKITSDRRVPLKEIHGLFAGTGSEKQVLDAIQSGKPDPTTLKRNKFYGHLYLGLYFEAQGDKKKSAAYIAKAANGYQTHGYMGQVARVHNEWLSKKLAK